MHIHQRFLMFILFSNLIFINIFIITKVDAAEFSSSIQGIKNIDKCKAKVYENRKIESIQKLMEFCNFISENGNPIYYKYGKYKLLFIYGDDVNKELKDVYNLIIDENKNFYFIKFKTDYIEGNDYYFYKKTETKSLMSSFYYLKLQGPRGASDGFPQKNKIWKFN